MTRLQRLASALLIGLATSGCAGKETPGPETNKLLAELPRVTSSPRDTCQTQREIAAQNSYVDTIRDGTEKVYKPPCELDRKQAPKAAKPPALSAAEKEFHETMDAELRAKSTSGALKKPPSVDADRARRTG